jgi:tRNA threonylcarbamoyladenosine biosynthesis protein TsaE
MEGALVLDRETRSAAETEMLGRAVGEWFASGVGVGTVWLLSGEMGAGKTVWVRGLLRGLGIEGRVRSPGFTLVTRYGGAHPVIHVDLYRLDRPELVSRFAFEDLLDPEAILLVEWGDRARGEVGSDRFEIEIEHLGKERRRIRIAALGRAQRLGRELEAILGGVRCE